MCSGRPQKNTTNACALEKVTTDLVTAVVMATIDETTAGEARTATAVVAALSGTTKVVVRAIATAVAATAGSLPQRTAAKERGTGPLPQAIQASMTLRDLSLSTTIPPRVHPATLGRGAQRYAFLGRQDGAPF